MIPLDKQAHFLAGTTICLSLALFVSPIIGLFAAGMLGLAKEAFDATGRGTPDIWDFVATALGGVAAFALIHISEMI